MKNYLSIILRNQFNLFYRFGYTFIAKDHLVEFTGEVNETSRRDIKKILSEVTPFEYEEEYLIIQVEKNGLIDKPFCRVQIQDVVKIFPLTSQSKASIETKIDSRIRLENPVFESILPEVENEINKNEVNKAIQVLWEICKIEGDLNEYISNIGIDNIFKGIERRKLGIKSAQIKDGNYWEYVIAYDRTDYFPNSILGLFYDAGQIFAYSKGLQTFEGSGIHQTLEILNNSNPNLKLRGIIEILESEEQGKKYIEKTTSNDVFQYLITPIFLMLRNEIRNSDDIKQTSLIKFQENLKEFGESFKYALILLGAFFGYKKFYDIYYDEINLKFYKTYIDKDANNIEVFEIEKNEPESDATSLIINETIQPDLHNKEKILMSDGAHKLEEESINKKNTDKNKVRITAGSKKSRQSSKSNKGDIKK